MPSTIELKRIVDLRNAALVKMRELVDHAESEGRGFDAAEQTAFDAHNDTMTALAVRADRIAAVDQQEADTAEMLRKTFGGNGGDQGGPTESADEKGLRAFLRGETKFYDAKAVRGSFGSRESRAAHLGVQTRDLVKGTSTAGGVLLPTTLYGSLVEFAVDSSGVLSAGPTILQTAGGESIDVPVVTSYGAAALVAEAAVIGESDPAFTKRTLGAYKYGQIVQVSRELIDDEVFDIEGFVARVAGRNIGIALGTDLAVGNGSSKPSGILQTATLGKTGGAGVAGAFAADDLIDLQMSVLPAYRSSPSAAWLMRDASLGGIRKLKDGAGRYVYDPATQVGAVDVLLGKALYTDPNIPAVALGAKSVLFGDVSQYFVRLAGGARFERSDEFAFNQDLVTFKAVLRGDGLLVDQTGAVKYFIGNAA